MRQSRPASISPEDARRITLPPVRLQNELEQAQRPDDVPSGRVISGVQPPLQTQQREGPSTLYGFHTTPISQHHQPLASASRTLGVHNILNPAEPERAPESLGAGLSGYARSPHLNDASFRPRGGPATPSGERLGSLNPLNTMPRTEVQGIQLYGRKILQPKSPRSVSVGGRRSGTIDVQQSPFVPSGGHVFASESVPAFPPIISPMPRAQGLVANLPNPPQPSDSAGDLRGRASLPMTAPIRAPASQSNSPSPSLTSSYSSQPSPALRQQMGQPSSAVPYFPGASFGAPMPGGAQASPGSEGPYMPPDSVYVGSQGPGQSSNFKMMSIAAEGGGHFYVPVDVQAASKVADEKRARNAGASARFRERKKAKEHEASTNIHKLEQQSKDLEKKARDLEQERDFYRSERDRFRDIVYRTPSTRDLATQAPPSPRLTRAHARAPPFAHHGSPSYALDRAADKDVAGRPPRRRRTEASSDYTFPQLPTSLPPVQRMGYTSVQARGSLPPMRTENIPSSGPPLLSAPAPTTEPPYAPTTKNIYDRK